MATINATNLNDVKSSKDLNLLNFINGTRGTDYTVPEERGFHTTGNIGALLNSNPNYMRSIHDGLLLNPKNTTVHSETIIGRIDADKHNWNILTNLQPETPLIYCNHQQLSELLPYYPNGAPNVYLTPNCNMQLDNVASPTLAGIATTFVNNPNVLNNPNNNIGHELQTYGFANNNGMRALSQGKNACQELNNGLNVPNLRVDKNDNSAYIANPAQFSEDVPLYQVGNWPDHTSNFLTEFNHYAGVGCN